MISGKFTPESVMDMKIEPNKTAKYYNKETGRFTPLAERMIENVKNVYRNTPPSGLTSPPLMGHTEGFESEESDKTPLTTPRRSAPVKKSAEHAHRPTASHGRRPTYGDRPTSSTSVSSEESNETSLTTPRRSAPVKINPAYTNRPTASHGRRPTFGDRPTSSTSVSSEQRFIETVTCKDTRPNPKKPQDSPKKHSKSRNLRPDSLDAFSHLNPGNLDGILDGINGSSVKDLTHMFNDVAGQNKVSTVWD
jgi:hypothetical protein